MSGFLYFLPGVKAATAEAIDAAGLGDVLQAGKTITRETRRGPGDAAGIVAGGVGTEASDCAYQPYDQTWLEIEDDAGEPTGAWLGYVTDSPPGPNDLIRADAVRDGYLRSMDAFGEPGDWIIPRARVYAEDIAEGAQPDSDLPQAIRKIGGKLVKTPLPRYRQACLDADRIWAAVMSANGATDEDPIELSAEEEYDIAARILAINYRVGVPELNALGVMTTETISAVIKCFVDWPAFVVVQIQRAEAAKKNDMPESPDIESMNSGERADSTDTAQPAPISNGLNATDTTTPTIGEQ